MRDPENYAVSVFGTPGAGGAVGLAARGAPPLAELHAGARQAARRHARPSSAPTRPRSARARSRGCARSRASRTWAGRSPWAWTTRSASGWSIAAQSLGDIVAGPGRRESLTTPAGVPPREMTPAQREALVQLVEEYARNMRAEVAERGAAATAGGRPRARPLRLGRAARRRARPLLPDPRTDPAHRVRQLAERRQPHPLRLARPPQRLRHRPPPRALRAQPPPPRLIDRRRADGWTRSPAHSPTAR